MDNTTRLQYLEAMGIDVWVSRAGAVVEMPVLADESTVDSWRALQKEVVECQNCLLCQSRRQTVFGEGDVNADWMLVADEPGESEDREGKPLVGEAGILLTEMIRAIGLQRKSVYLTHITKCHPEGSRKAKSKELMACNDYLQREIALVKPKIILAIGRVAAQTLLGTKEPLSALREVPHQLNGIPLVVVYHPAYLLRSLHEKRKAWQDLQLAMKQIRN